MQVTLVTQENTKCVILARNDYIHVWAHKIYINDMVQGETKETSLLVDFGNMNWQINVQRNGTAGWTQKYVYPDWQLVVRIVVTNYCYSYVTKRICLKCIMSPASSYCLNSDRFPIIIMSYFTHQIIGSKWVLMKVSQHTRKCKVCTWTKYAYIYHALDDMIQEENKEVPLFHIGNRPETGIDKKLATTERTDGPKP